VRTGAARALLVAAVSSTALLLVLGAAWAETFPAEGSGDIRFQADCASFLGPTGDVDMEFYVQVRSDQLNFLTKAGQGSAQVRLTAGFIDELGEEYETRTKEFTLARQDEVSEAGPSGAGEDAHIVMVRYPVSPKLKRVRITLEDLRARRRGILYLFTKERKSGTVIADVSPAFPLKGTLSLSDIEFAWTISPGAAGSFPKSGLDVVPNPSRSYGLMRPNLAAYVEVYDQSELAARSDKVFYSVISTVFDVDRQALISDTQRVVSSTDEWVCTVRLDLSKLPGGGHWLRVEVVNDKGTARAIREGEFDLLWYNASWKKTDQDMLDEASLFLGAEQSGSFKRMAPGEREKFLEDFWTSMDPTPGTARNEVREEFYRRVAYANKNFTFFGKGMLSDRGRIYIRYGEPDLVERQVVPTSGDAADIVVDQLIGRANIDAAVKEKLGGRDKKSYEVWIYNMRGKPLFENPDRVMSQSLGLKFVFVDDAGVGNFILEYSSDHSEFK
jgi:GWxTD domain-containing protein